MRRGSESESLALWIPRRPVTLLSGAVILRLPISGLLAAVPGLAVTLLALGISGLAIALLATGSALAVATAITGRPVGKLV